jgi:hypothetical protein
MRLANHRGSALARARPLACLCVRDEASGLA